MSSNLKMAVEIYEAVWAVNPGAFSEKEKLVYAFMKTMLTYIDSTSIDKVVSELGKYLTPRDDFECSHK